MQQQTGSKSTIDYVHQSPVTEPTAEVVDKRDRVPLVPRGQKFAGPLMMMANEQGGQQQRVPIYRSFFKSFKGPHGRHHQQQANQVAVNGYPTGPRGNVVAIARRRRDRVHNHHLPLVSSLRQQQEASSSQPKQVPIEAQAAAPFASSPLGSPSRYQQGPHSAPGNAGAAMASYLQLLNSRYNLRLAHV